MHIPRFFPAAAAACLALAALAGCGGDAPGDGAPRNVGGELFRLAHMNGCIECHIVNASTVGPSWNAISERYKDAPLSDARALLIESVKKGSRGKWVTWKGADGMPPLEGRVSEEHMEQLVDYILSLKRPR